MGKGESVKNAAAVNTASLRNKTAGIEKYSLFDDDSNTALASCVLGLDVGNTAISQEDGGGGATIVR